MAKPTIGPDNPEASLAEWIQWKAESAREIAVITDKYKIERWHTTTIRLHWQWAGHAARRPGTPNHVAATVHTTPARRGRPPPHWAQMLRNFSIEELRGNAESWVVLAHDKAGWNEFSKVFTEFVETHILRADTRATLARDAIAIKESQEDP